MTLANMRAKGVLNLAAWCLERGYNYHRVIDVSRFGDDVPVPAFGPRLRPEAAVRALRAPRRRRATELERASGNWCVYWAVAKAR
jgi:hypothetical protein